MCQHRTGKLIVELCEPSLLLNESNGPYGIGTFLLDFHQMHFRVIPHELCQQNRFMHIYL